MSLHLRPLPNAHDIALKQIKAETTRQLMTEIAAERAPRPRHFDERIRFRQTGEK